MHLNKNEAYEQAHIGAQAAELLDKKVSQLWSLQIFHFHPKNCRKNKLTNFLWKYELRQLIFLGKVVSKSFFITTCRLDICCWDSFAKEKLSKVYIYMLRTNQIVGFVTVPAWKKMIFFITWQWKQ